MNIRVILIEDEVWVRRAIIQEIDWKSGSLENVGFAIDGPAALELIMQEKPDVVLTDIRIPGFDGLELVQRIRNEYPSIRFVIVSGHDEFEYAQQALRLGVTDYVLKPVKKNEIMTILTRIREELMMERSTNSYRNKLSRKLQTYESLVRQPSISTGSFETSDSRIDRALHMIRTRFNEQLTLADIAAEAGMSRSNFSKIFREEVGDTFINYLTTIRIESSMELLKHHELSIRDIAAMVGFSDANYFAKQFRRWNGIGPGEYRRKY